MTSSPRAVIFSCEGTTLTAQEKRLFTKVSPLGFILFQRNCADKAQVQALIDNLLATVTHRPVPILIDQEGGKVMRLKPPVWPHRLAADVFAKAWLSNPEAAIRACYLQNALIAMDLAELGITVNCTPVLDWPAADADPIIGSRAFGTSSDSIVALAQAVIDAHLDHGVLPIIKHIPGHGRARVDSHKALPVVETPLPTLQETDFKPFQNIQRAPWAMTAHIVYTAIDADHCATISPTMINDVIRGSIGFNGFLISDDLGMHALQGSLREKATASLNAGCDAVLHCSGNFDEMLELQETAPCTPLALRRLEQGWSLRHHKGDASTYHHYSLELDALLSDYSAAS